MHHDNHINLTLSFHEIHDLFQLNILPYFFIIILICCFFSRDIYLSFGISLSNLVFSILIPTVSELFCGERLDIFVILSVILLPIKSLVAPTVF